MWADSPTVDRSIRIDAPGSAGTVGPSLLSNELPLGRGTVDWRALVDAAAALPAPPLAVLELAKLDEIAESLAYLEREGLLRG